MKFLQMLFSGMFLLVFCTGVALAGGDATAGANKAGSCAGCHGANGEGMEPNPPLAGMDEAYFVEQLQAFKSGARENQMMQMFAGQLSDQDMADLAAYYAGLGGE